MDHEWRVLALENEKQRQGNQPNQKDYKKNKKNKNKNTDSITESDENAQPNFVDNKMSFSNENS